MPATIGLAMLVPLPVVPFAVRTLTAGAETFGLLKSPCEFHAALVGSRYEAPSDEYHRMSSPRPVVFRSLMPPTVSTL